MSKMLGKVWSVLGMVIMWWEFIEVFLKSFLVLISLDVVICMIVGIFLRLSDYVVNIDFILK